MHHIERKRVADAARIYCYSENLSPQAFADRITRHPKVPARPMREGVRPISRRAISNLLDGAAVKSVTIEAVKKFICIEKGLPTHVFDVTPKLIAAAKAEMQFRMTGVYPHSHFHRYVGSFQIIRSKSRFYLACQVEYDDEDRLLLARGKANIAPQTSRLADQSAYFSGYAVPVEDRMIINASDGVSAEPFLIDIFVPDLLKAGRGTVLSPTDLVLHQSRQPARLLFPTRADPDQSYDISASKNPLRILNQALKEVDDQELWILPMADDGDLFGIGGERYRMRHG